MKSDDDKIVPVEFYKGVPIHDCQPADRIEVVKRDIDRVLVMEDEKELFEFLSNYHLSPEGRILAGTKLKMLHEVAIAERRERPAVGMDVIVAWLCGLDSRRWRSTTHYGSGLDPLAPPRSQWKDIERNDESRSAVERDLGEIETRRIRNVQR